MENTVFIIHQLYLFCHSTSGSELWAQGLPDRAGSPPGPAGEQPGKAAPYPPTPHPTLDFRFKEGGAAAEKSDGLSTQAGEEEGECRAIPDCPERCWSPARAGLHPLESPPPLSVSRELGALNAQEGEPWGWGVGRRGGEAERPADTLEVRQARPLVQARLTERSQGPDRRPGAGPGGA